MYGVFTKSLTELTYHNFLKKFNDVRLKKVNDNEYVILLFRNNNWYETNCRVFRTIKSNKLLFWKKEESKADFDIRAMKYYNDFITRHKINKK